jgi:arginine exporter protein ArgO
MGLIQYLVLLHQLAVAELVQAVDCIHLMWVGLAAVQKEPQLAAERNQVQQEQQIKAEQVVMVM